MADNLRVNIDGDASGAVNAADQSAAAFERLAKAQLQLADAQSQTKSIMDAYRSGVFNTSTAVKELATTLQTQKAAALAAAAANKEIEGANAVAASSFKGLTNAAAMFGGRLVGMEAGVGMLGGQFARMGAAAGFAGPLLVAMIPIAAIAGAIELYSKWEEHLIKLNDDVAAVNRTMGEGNNRLLEQQERLAGITGGPLAEYGKQLGDIGNKFPTLSSGLETFNKLLEEQDNWWVKTRTDAQLAWDVIKGFFASGGSITGAATAAGVSASSYMSAQEVGKYTSGIQASIHSNNDLAGAIKKVAQEQQTLQQMVNTSSGVYKEQNQAALENITDYLNRLKQQYQDFQNQKKTIQSEAHSHELQDNVSLVEAEKAGIDARMAAQQRLADVMDKIAEKRSSPGGAVDTVADVTAKKDAAITKAMADYTAAVARAKADNSAQQAVFTAQVAAAQGNADKIKEIKQKQSDAEEVFITQQRTLYQEYVLAKVTAEQSAAEKIKAITVKTAEEQANLQRKTYEDEMRDADASYASKRSLLQKQAQAGIVDRLSETQQLQALDQQQLASATANLKAQLALEEQLRSKITGAGGDTNSQQYVASQQRTDQLNTQLDTTQKKLNSDIAATGVEIQQLNHTWGNFLDQLTTKNKNIAVQFRAQWQDTINQLNTGMANAFNQWMEHGGSFTRMMSNLGVEMLANWSSMLIQMGMRWLETHIMMAIVGKTTGAASAASQVAAQAAVAGAGGVASMAAAPFPLDTGAPAFGAAMFADAMTYAAAATAERGGFIPGAVGQAVPMVGHGQELVIPAHMSSFLNTAATASMSRKGGIGGGLHIGNITIAPTVNGNFDPKTHGTAIVNMLTSKLSTMGVAIR